jgi:hemerythrin
MTALAIKEFNGATIRVRTSDRYHCLTDMAKAAGKLFADWQRLKTTKSYLDTLSRIMGIPIIQLIEVNVGNLGSGSGTYGHPKVAIRFAQWCSDEFAVQVDTWIEELLLTGKVELNQNQQNLLEAQRLADSVLVQLQQINALSPTVYETAKAMIVKTLNLQPSVAPTSSQNDLNASLVANRLGLTFNKHLKAFEMLEDTAGIESYAKLKKAHSQLIKDYQELLQDAQPSNDCKPYVDKIAELSQDLERAKSQLVVLKTINKNLEKEIEFIRLNLQSRLLTGS